MLSTFYLPVNYMGGLLRIEKKNEPNINSGIKRLTITVVAMNFLCSCVFVTTPMRPGYTTTPPPQGLRENTNSPYINNTGVSNPPPAQQPPFYSPQPSYPSRNIGIVPPVGRTPIVINQPGREGDHNKEDKNGEHEKKNGHEKKGQNGKAHEKSPKKGEENKNRKQNHLQGIPHDKQNKSNNGNNTKYKNGHASNPENQ